MKSARLLGNDLLELLSISLVSALTPRAPKKRKVKPFPALPAVFFFPFLMRLGWTMLRTRLTLSSRMRRM